MHCVITTVNKPTKAVEKWHEIFGDNLIIVGDKKTPEDWNHNGITPIQSTKLYAPDNHYSKKNAGYMQAIENKASFIYDTDDDNMPRPCFHGRLKSCYADKSDMQGWFNVYKWFTQENIWPRGFSLKHITVSPPIGVRDSVSSSIQQGAVDIDPDVDAIWRLALKKEIRFREPISIYLNSGAWCPFNSQSTWWFPKAYPLMYLPVHATFRMCDIWRSFVAQRCLWELGEGVTFHSPSEVFQDRNEHDLMKDFEDEIPGYLNNDRIVEILASLELKGSVVDNMLVCYSFLVSNNILPLQEIESLIEWVKDYEHATGNIS